MCIVQISSTLKLAIKTFDQTTINLKKFYFLNNLGKTLKTYKQYFNLKLRSKHLVKQTSLLCLKNNIKTFLISKR